MTKAERQKRNKARRDVIDLLMLVICIPIIAIGIITTFSILQSKRAGNVPSIFGYSFATVVSGSMEPYIMTGESIVVKQVDARDIKVGDIITFHRGSQIVTHKVNKITTAMVNGRVSLAFQTYGINNINQDTGKYIMDSSIVVEQNIVGKFVKKGGMASFVKFMSSSWGMMCFVIIPLGIVIISDILSLFGITKEIKEDKFDELYKTKRELNLVDKEVEDYVIAKSVTENGKTYYILTPESLPHKEE